MLFFREGYCGCKISGYFARGKPRKVRRSSGNGVFSAGGVRSTFWRNTGSDMYRVHGTREVNVNVIVNED